MWQSKTTWKQTLLVIDREKKGHVNTDHADTTGWVRQPFLFQRHWKPPINQAAKATWSIQLWSRWWSEPVYTIQLPSLGTESNNFSAPAEGASWSKRDSKKWGSLLFEETGNAIMASPRTFSFDGHKKERKPGRRGYSIMLLLLTTMFWINVSLQDIASIMHCINTSTKQCNSDTALFHKPSSHQQL